MTETNTTKKCPFSPHSGPVGCVPAPNIFPLAKKTFAKGKMFWTKKIQELKKSEIVKVDPKNASLVILWYRAGKKIGGKLSALNLTLVSVFSTPPESLSKSFLIVYWAVNMIPYIQLIFDRESLFSNQREASSR